MWLELFLTARASGSRRDALRRLIRAAWDLAQAVTAWLRQQLARQEFHIRFAATFGPVTQTYPTRDIDVLVQFKPGSDDRNRKADLRVKALARTFTAEFQLPLHLQLFSSTETDRLLKFALRAGSFDILIGADYWAEVSDPRTSPSSEIG